MRKIVVAIDGYSACGKSSTAKQVASALEYKYIDSGAMYRATTLYFLEHYVNLDNPKDVAKALANLHIDFHYNERNGKNETYLNGLNVEEEIRTMRVSEKVSEVSTIKEVRHAMVAQQQKMGKSKGVVMDGRDIGTVVFPQADLKVFMTADMDVRAGRRQEELLAAGTLVDLDEIKQNLAHRDHLDSTRKESPLIKADDAIEIDTSFLSFEDQVAQVVGLAKKIINK